MSGIQLRLGRLGNYVPKSTLRKRSPLVYVFLALFWLWSQTIAGVHASQHLENGGQEWCQICKLSTAGHQVLTSGDTTSIYTVNGLNFAAPSCGVDRSSFYRSRNRGPPLTCL